MDRLGLNISRRGAACRLVTAGACAVRPQRRLGCKASLAQASGHIRSITSQRSFQSKHEYSTTTPGAVPARAKAWERAAPEQSGACQHTAATQEQEEVPIWKIALAGMTVGSVLGGGVWFLTKATPASSAARPGEYRFSDGAAPPADAGALQEYHIFYVHPPGSSCDADTVMRVEMDIQDLEREFEEHEGKLREAQEASEKFEMAHPSALSLWDVGSWQSLLDWVAFQRLRWAVERERNIMTAIEERQQGRIRHKLTLLRVSKGKQGGKS